MASSSVAQTQTPCANVSKLVLIVACIDVMLDMSSEDKGWWWEDTDHQFFGYLVSYSFGAHALRKYP